MTFHLMVFKTFLPSIIKWRWPPA